MELESTADFSRADGNGVLPAVVEFLDHFDAALDVVVGCARKTEPTRWRRLFGFVGNPKTLFEASALKSRVFVLSLKIDDDRHA